VVVTIVIDELIGLAVRSRRRKAIVEHQERNGSAPLPALTRLDAGVHMVGRW
jgi:hypothetical protein